MGFIGHDHELHEKTLIDPRELDEASAPCENAPDTRPASMLQPATFDDSPGGGLVTIQARPAGETEDHW